MAPRRMSGLFLPRRRSSPPRWRRRPGARSSRADDKSKGPGPRRGGRGGGGPRWSGGGDAGGGRGRSSSRRPPRSQDGPGLARVVVPRPAHDRASTPAGRASHSRRADVVGGPRQGGAARPGRPPTISRAIATWCAAAASTSPGSRPTSARHAVADVAARPLVAEVDVSDHGDLLVRVGTPPPRR